MTLVCGPGSSVVTPLKPDECWAKTGMTTTDYPIWCKAPVDPDGLGLCDHHLAVFRRDQRGS